MSSQQWLQVLSNHPLCSQIRPAARLALSGAAGAWSLPVPFLYNISAGLSMEDSFQVLSNVYNFVQCEPKPAVAISLPLLSQFVHIHSLLQNFCESDQDPKSTFHDLYLFLVQQEQAFGPRKFRQLLEALTTVVVQYVVAKLRSRCIDKGILCLTYFQRSCQKYLNAEIRMLLSCTFALAQLTKGTYSVMENYLATLNSLLPVYQKTSKTEHFLPEFKLLQSLFTGTYFYCTTRLTKAKSVFSEMISTLTLHIHQQQSRRKVVPLLTAHFFVLATYHIALTYKALGQSDVAAYNLTQCHQFASQHLPQSCHFTRKCQEGSQFVNQRVVKLSRIQNKIERIKSLHSISNFQRLSKEVRKLKIQQREPKMQQSEAKMQQREAKMQQREAKEVKITKEVEVPALVLKKELSKLFMVQEKGGGKLKYRTLRGIQKQSEQKMERIQNFKQQIRVFEKQKSSISQQYQLDQQLQQIADIQLSKQALQADITAKMWAVAGSLSATRKIGHYVWAFKAFIGYQKISKFYRLYSKVGVSGRLALCKFIRRYKSKLQRVSISSTHIKGCRHLIEFLLHRVTRRTYIKVYNVEAGAARVDHQLQLQQPTFAALLAGQSLEQHFNIVQNKLWHFSRYFESLPEKVQLQVRLFLFKLKHRMQKKRQSLSYSKHLLSVSFGLKRSSLSYTLFVASRKTAPNAYSHRVERIDCMHYPNPDYNISVNTEVRNDSFMMGNYDLNALVVGELLKAKQGHQGVVVGLQQLLRRKGAAKAASRLREGTGVSTAKINKTLFTLVLTANCKTFFVEHLQRKYPLQILKGVEYGNLAFVNKLRNELQSTEDCLLQLTIIKKYYRLKEFGQRMVTRSREFTLTTNFSTKFKKSLCFAKTMKQILYKGKLVQCKATYTLIIKDFQVFPRPYLLRVFNLQCESLYSFDFERVIYMSQKVFLESNLARINMLIDIQGYKLGSILSEGPKLMAKSKRMNSKSTVLSNYSYSHESLEEVMRQNSSRVPANYHVQARASLIVSRNKKNSINYKMRHKSALKQKDILLIKKWIQDCKENQLVSEPSESSGS